MDDWRWMMTRHRFQDFPLFRGSPDSRKGDGLQTIVYGYLFSFQLFQGDAHSQRTGLNLGLILVY